MASAATKLGCDTCPVHDRAACSALSASERDELAAFGRHRHLKAGEKLFHAGGNSDQCATLIAGALKIRNSDSEGVERVLSLIHPAGFVGELFAPVAHHDVVALTDSEVCLFPSTRYGEVVERFPALGRALLRRSSEDLFAAHALIDLMGRRSALQKVAGFLKAMADAASHSPCHPAELFELPVSRGDMAGMLGLTIETVSRQMGRLEKDGVIERQGPRGIRLRDAARLARVAT